MKMVFAALALTLGFASVGSAACREGTTAVFQVPRDGNTDRYVNEIRTCVNGRFYPKSVTQGVRCKEGARTLFTEPRDGYTDRYVTVVRTCVNGRYYPKSYTRGIACKEGAISYRTFDDGYTDRHQSVAQICRNGKYVDMH